MYPTLSNEELYRNNLGKIILVLSLYWFKLDRVDPGTRFTELRHRYWLMSSRPPPKLLFLNRTPQIMGVPGEHPK